MLQLNSAMEAIEVERADEASGTGMLGSVSFGQRDAGHHAPPPTAAPRARSSRSARVRRTHRTARRHPPSALRRLASSCPARWPARSPRPRALPTSPPDPAPVVPQPVASAPPAGRASPIRRTCRASRSRCSRPRHLLPSPSPSRLPRRDPSCPTRRRAPPLLARRPTTRSRPTTTTTTTMIFRASRRSGSRPGSGSRLPSRDRRRRDHRRARGDRGLLRVRPRRPNPSEQTFAKTAAPFSFSYPKDFHQRRLDGGVALNKPTYQVGFGLDSSNYLLASTYKLGFTVAGRRVGDGPEGPAADARPDQPRHRRDDREAGGSGGLHAEGRRVGQPGAATRPHLRLREARRIVLEHVRRRAQGQDRVLRHLPEHAPRREGHREGLPAHADDLRPSS